MQRLLALSLAAMILITVCGDTTVSARIGGEANPPPADASSIALDPLRTISGFQGIIQEVRSLQPEDGFIRAAKECDTIIVVRVTGHRQGPVQFDVGIDISLGVEASPTWNYYSGKEISFSFHWGRKYPWLWAIGC